MRNLFYLVKKYFPEENIIDEKDVFFSSKYGTLGSLTSGSETIQMIETENMLFFDIRPIFLTIKPFLESGKKLLKSITAVLIFLMFFLIYFLFIDKVQDTNIKIKIFLLITVFPLLYLMINWKKSIANIVAIRKEWIAVNTTMDDGSRLIEWSLPSTELGFSFVHQIYGNAQSKLNLLERAQAGVYSKEFKSDFFRAYSSEGFHKNIIVYK